MGIVARQSIKGSIFSYLGAFIGFVNTIFIVTALMDSEIYGLLGVIVEAGTLLGSFSMMGIGSAGIKFFPFFKSADGKHNGFFFYLLAIPLIGVALFFSLAVIFKAPIISYFSEHASLFVDYFWWIFPLAFFFAYQSVFATYSNVLMRVVVPRFVQEVLVRVLNMAIFVLFGFNIISLQWLVALQVMVYAAAMLVNLFYLSRINKLSLEHDVSFVSPELRKQIARYSCYTLLAVIGSGIMIKIDTFMVGGMLGLSQLGIYRVALFMGVIVEIPSRSLFAIAQPIASEAIKNNNVHALSDLLKKVSINLLLIGTAIFLLLYINRYDIFAIMPNGEYYATGQNVMIFIALANLINITFMFNLYILQLSRYYLYYLPFLLLLTLVGILGNYYLLPVLGITGGALSKLITYAFVSTVLTLFVYWKMKIHPFTIKHLYMVLILVGGIAVDYVLPVFSNPIADGIYRTLLIGGTGAVLVYRLKISPDANQIADNILRKIKLNK
ncbi:MAG: oligosaccharide flippase family protein [Bacteroidales bacterium]|nr:oligosaccharide flippase family protein [Bacteroidales bacterium]